MTKWPGKIAPRVSNQMVSIHDFAPTLASIIGAKLPTDRPIDGVEQSAFFTGKQATSNREGLITFIGEEIVAVRWRQYRLYPKEFISTTGNPAMTGLTGCRAEGNGFPAIFNIEADPREEVNILGYQHLGARPVSEADRRVPEDAGDSTRIPKAVNLTQFGR